MLQDTHDQERNTPSVPLRSRESVVHGIEKTNNNE
jgi:hypothetical protein